MTQSVPTLRCRCGEGELVVAYTYHEPPPGEILFGVSGPYYREYRACKTCGHYFSRHTMELTDLYSGAYADATYGGPEGMRRAFDRIVALPPEKSDNTGRVARVNEFASRRFKDRVSGRTLLDVGAGLGVFPYAMRNAGWEVTALDPDPRNEDHYREVIGVKPLISDFLGPPATDIGERFDVISFNKVLEHVPDPVSMLSRATELCAPAGFIYIELPDVAASVEGKNREEFLFGHDHVFSISSTAILMERAGVLPAKVERLREPSGKFTIFAFGIPTVMRGA